LTPGPAGDVWQNGDYERLTGNNMNHSQDHTPITNTIETQSIDMVERQESGFAYDSEAPTYQDCFPATGVEDFNHALLSLQTGKSALSLKIASL
jgi:hypothetical protein